ncbi:hypothetical protein N7470_004494 [Penicillium chermesinum]|nr:hypothetical protein N7470_004494 [Penicillium chermesinum]
MSVVVVFQKKEEPTQKQKQEHGQEEPHEGLNTTHAQMRSMFLDRGSSVPNTANLEVSGVCIYFSRLARVKGRNQDPRSGALFFYVMTLLRDSLRATLPRDLADGLRCA